MSTFTISGEEALIRVLDSLEKPASIKRVMRPSMRKALSPMNKRAKKLAKGLTAIGDSHITGALSKSIGILKLRSFDGGMFQSVGVRWRPAIHKPDPLNPKILRIPFYYQLLVESGTSKVPGRSYLEAAFDQTVADMKSILVKETGVNLAKELAKIRAKAGSK